MYVKMSITVWLCRKYVSNVCLGHGSCILGHRSVLAWVSGSWRWTLIVTYRLLCLWR